MPTPEAIDADQVVILKIPQLHAITRPKDRLVVGSIVHRGTPIVAAEVPIMFWLWGARHPSARSGILRNDGAARAAFSNPCTAACVGSKNIIDNP